MTRLRLAGSLLLAGLVGLTACSGGEQPPPTAVVDRGVVSTGVSASGSLVSITQQNLGFTEGGRITELLVEVGETVAAGSRWPGWTTPRPGRRSSPRRPPWTSSRRRWAS